MQDETQAAVGGTARRIDMATLNTTTRTSAASSVVVQTLIVALVGAILVFTSGLAHSQTLHDAAHDVRHATGFPCH